MPEEVTHATVYRAIDGVEESLRRLRLSLGRHSRDECPKSEVATRLSSVKAPLAEMRQQVRDLLEE